MNEEIAKKIAKTVQEFYLYPYRSKEENAARGIIWMASWLVGVVVQPADNQRALGGAYIIYAVSLLMEFVSENRKCPAARVVHGIFCFLMALMLIGSLLWVFGDNGDKKAVSKGVVKILMEAPPWAGWIVFIMILGGVVLALLDVHKIFYDEEAVLQQETELMKKAVLKQFYENLNGDTKGGNIS